MSCRRTKCSKCSSLSSFSTICCNKSTKFSLKIQTEIQIRIRMPRPGSGQASKEVKKGVENVNDDDE